MRLLTLFITTLTIIPSFISAVAVPTVAPRNETLVKRGGEVNYLANCKRYNDEDDVDYAASYVAWYANVDNSLSGHDVREMDISSSSTRRTDTVHVSADSQFIVERIS